MLGILIIKDMTAWGLRSLVKPSIRICFCFAENTALRNNSKDWLAQFRNNVPQLSQMLTLVLMFQEADTRKNPTRHFCLVQSEHRHDLIDLKCKTCSRQSV